MDIKHNRLLALLLALMLIFAQAVPAGAAEGGTIELVDEVILTDSIDDPQLVLNSFESTANGTGSLYSTLNTRQKTVYNVLKDIQWNSIISASGYRVPVKISGITGTVLNGGGSGGVFFPTGSSVQVYESIKTDVDAALTALRYDRPDLLWLDYSVGSNYRFVGSGGRYVISEFSFNFSLPYGGQENTMRERMMAQARSIAAEAAAEPDMYNKVKKVHDILAARSTYNRYPPSEMARMLSHCAYSALIGGDGFEPVCDGYSKAFKIVLNIMDIPCAVVVNDDHMWNNVKMDDGLWYNVDLTWDDNGDIPSTAYFLVGSGTSIYGTPFSQSHPERDPFNESIASGARYPSKNTVAYKYIGGDYPKTTYPDVPRSDYAYEYIEIVSKLGYFAGDSAGYFRPAKQITRAEFARVTASVLGEDVEQYNGMYSFSDVGTGKWYSGVVYWARESGIMVGAGGKFRPDDPISRQEMCSVLARAFGLEGSSGRIFPDDSSIDSWAKEGVYACQAAGLVNGSTDGKFNPKNNTVRRDAAIVFAKYAELVGVIPGEEQ